MRLPVAVALVLVLASLVVPAARVQACSCAFLGGDVDIVEQAVRGSDVAFLGEVVAAEPAGMGGLGPETAYEFAVARSNVAVPHSVHVRSVTGDGGVSCGFSFEVGETWFVTATNQDGALHTGLCSGNTRTDGLSDADLAHVEALLPLEPAVASPADRGFGVDPGLVVVVLAALAVLGFTAWAFRRPASG